MLKLCPCFFWVVDVDTRLLKLSPSEVALWLCPCHQPTVLTQCERLDLILKFNLLGINFIVYHIESVMFHQTLLRSSLFRPLQPDCRPVGDCGSVVH